MTTREERLQAMRDRLDDLSLQELVDELPDALDGAWMAKEYSESVSQRVIKRMKEEGSTVVVTGATYVELGKRGSWDWPPDVLRDIEAELRTSNIPPEKYLDIETTYTIKPGMGETIIYRLGPEAPSYIHKERSIKPRNSKRLMEFLDKLGSLTLPLRQRVTVGSTDYVKAVMRINDETGEILDD